MWHPRPNTERIDYRRMDYVYQQHHARYTAYVKAHGLVCQECGGVGESGYSYDPPEPPEPCGYCERTGLVTRWIRGQWLRWKRDEKRAREAKRRAA